MCGIKNAFCRGKILLELYHFSYQKIRDILFKTFLKTEEGAEIDGYIKKGSKNKKNVLDEEGIEIEGIVSKNEYKKPTLVKNNKKEAI